MGISFDAELKFDLINNGLYIVIILIKVCF